MAWQNYGDRDFLDYGGLLINRTQNGYEVIEIITGWGWDELGEDNVFVSEYFVDKYDIDDFKDRCQECNGQTDEMAIVLYNDEYGLASYYGCKPIDSYYTSTDMRDCIVSKKEAAKFLLDNGIDDDSLYQYVDEGKYVVEGYYDGRFNGLAECQTFVDRNRAEDYVWELVNKGLSVEFHDADSDKIRKFTPDKLDESLHENGDVYGIEDAEVE